MSLYYTTRAIIFGEEPWREQDLRLEVLTEHEGKRDYILRGGRAIYSKLRPHALVFDRTTLTVVARGSMSYITQAQLEQHLVIDEYLLTRQRAAAVACALARMARPDSADVKQLFNELDDVLVDINQRQKDFLVPLMRLLAHILQVSGIKPLLEECRTCRQRVSTHESLVFALPDGAIFHETCSHPVSSEAMSGPEWSRLVMLLQGQSLVPDQVNFQRLVRFARFHLEA